MRPDEHATEEPDFNFEAWAAGRTTKPPLDQCARAALECLAVSNDDLRSRLRASLFCLLYTDPTMVPSVHRAAFDEISGYVAARLEGEQTFAALMRFTRKLKLKSAKRLARKVFRAMLGRGVTGWPHNHPLQWTGPGVGVAPAMRPSCFPAGPGH